MNPITKFFHELFNPHCEHCLAQHNQELENRIIAQEMIDTHERESQRCESCESLRIQLALVNQQNTLLIDRLTAKPEVVQVVNTGEAPRVLHRGATPLSVVRNIREAESRRAAEAIKNAAQPDLPIIGTPAAAELTAAVEEIKDLEDMVINANTKRLESTGTKQA